MKGGGLYVALQSNDSIIPFAGAPVKNFEEEKGRAQS